MNETQLIEEAYAAREKAYAPYSNFLVGAALLGKSGKIYRGCNIENASFGAGICAERTAFASAISQGETTFVAIAIVGGDKDARNFHYCPPCGICRQFMREFCSPDQFTILLDDTEEGRKRFLLKDLLPESFGPDQLAK